MKPKEKIAFTLRIDKELAAKIDYVAEYYATALARLFGR